MTASARRVWVWHKKAWHKGRVESVTRGKAKLVRLDSSDLVVSTTHIMPQKHNGRRTSSGCKGEKLPTRRVGPRPARAHPPSITIEPVSFRGPNRHGDYGWQLAPEQIDTYGDKLHIYNENVSQQRDKQDAMPGGGNAIARMYRPSGRAIGMPTGEYGGFTGLLQNVGYGGDDTAKTVIDEAMDEIEDHLLANPQFKTVYYCTNAAEADVRKDLIGMGIFQIERGVRVYITDKIKGLPKALRIKYMTERRQALERA